jgi:oxaloacetate decarboxylase alpha subunit
MTRNAIRFVDTTLRDGQMSLWATAMTTSMMVPAAAGIERAGFAAAEIAGGAFFKKIVRDLREDPFERIRTMKALMPTTPLRLIHSRHALAFQITPPALYELWVRRLVAHGVEEVRLSDPSNTLAGWAHSVTAARGAGMKATVNLTYSVSPRHTDAYYAQKARDAATLPVAGICLKDPGGLLRPERMRALVPLIQREIGDLPLEFHGHCNNGQGQLNALEAMKLGIRTVNCAIPPLADGGSLPNVFRTVRNARALGFDTDIDLDPLTGVTEHFEQVRRSHALPQGVPADYDESYYHHQVPGGMASNLLHQLDVVGMGERLDEVLDEIGRVRADLGYPIMVTPYSQFVGTQATLNVMTGERYGQVIDEIVLYALGYWGAEEAANVDLDVRDRLLGSARAAELRDRVDPDVTLDDLRRSVDGAGVSEDELLLRLFAGTEAVSRLTSSPVPPSKPAAAVKGWATLVHALSQERGFRQVRVTKGGSSIQLDRAG